MNGSVVTLSSVLQRVANVNDVTYGASRLQQQARAQHINAADVCQPDNIRLIPSSSFAVHKLITYSFHHQTETQILLSIGVLVLLCGGIEKTVGTVWFLLMFQLLSINTGVLYTTVGLVLFGASAQNQVEGLVPVSPSLMGMATVYSLMVKGFLIITHVSPGLAVSSHSNTFGPTLSSSATPS